MTIKAISYARSTHSINCYSSEKVNICREKVVGKTYYISNIFNARSTKSFVSKHILRTYGHKNTHKQGSSREWKKKKSIIKQKSCVVPSYIVRVLSVYQKKSIKIVWRRSIQRSLRFQSVGNKIKVYTAKKPTTTTTNNNINIKYIYVLTLCLLTYATLLRL